MPNAISHSHAVKIARQHGRSTICAITSNGTTAITHRNNTKLSGSMLRTAPAPTT